MCETLIYREYIGGQIKAVVEQLARLRITVFREYPYLYHGSVDYEQNYLSTYSTSPNAYCGVLFGENGNTAVGATTANPLLFETDEVKKPFISMGYDINTICYFGESIIMKKYRGMGYGKMFFQKREAYACETIAELRHTTFCAVVRPESHPLKPANYKPLNPFWESLGYHKKEELQTTFKWKDISNDYETIKKMIFWLKKW